MTPAATDLSDLAGVTTWTAAYDYCHDRYQSYYSTGLSLALREAGVPLTSRPLSRLPYALRALRRVRSSYRLPGLMKVGVGAALDRVAAAVGGHRLPPSGRFHSLAGQYEFDFRTGERLRLVVDAQDGGEVADPALLASCDVYAKSNYRPAIGYPDRVVPVCNGNPLVLPHLAELSRLRRSPPVRDLCFVVRVWGGRDEAAGVEHNLRLLEAVNRVDCRKYLLAYLVAGDLGGQEARLRKQGIPTTRTPIPLKTLWEISASSRINVIRLGMHNCVPWRFMDLLAMGACVALDQPPQTLWAPPLIDGEHALDLGAATDPGSPVAAGADYERIPARLERFLGGGDRLQRVRDGAARYFDAHAQPVAVGRYLLARVAKARDRLRAAGGPAERDPGSAGGAEGRPALPGGIE